MSDQGPTATTQSSAFATDPSRTADPLPSSTSASRTAQIRRWLISPARAVDVRGPRSLLFAVVATLTLLSFKDSQDAYLLTVLTTICITALLALGLDLILGYTGMFSFGHAAFMGVGAYITAKLLLDTSVPFWLALVLSVVGAAVVGVPVGLMAMRIQGDYFALVTLGFGQIAFLVFSNWTSVTGGQTGLPGIPIVDFFGWQILTVNDVYLFAAIITLVVFCLCALLVRSHIGRAMEAVREDPIIAASQGIRVGLVQVAVFALGSGIAGLAGALQAIQLSFVGATSYTLTIAVLAIEVVVVGGSGTVWGALLGAAALTTLTEAFRPAAEYRQAIFGLLLIIVLVFFRGGLVGIVDTILSRIAVTFGLDPRGRKKSAAAAGASTAAVEGTEPNSRQAITGPSPELLLETSSVEKRFGGVVAVSDLSLGVRTHEILTVIGPNGSGKTTLLNMLSGIYRPTSGQLTVEGRRTKFMSAIRVARRLRFARTFQNIRLCESMTVIDNVLIGGHLYAGISGRARRRSVAATSRSGSLRGRALECLELLGISAIAKVPVGSLSYGSQRRVEIARGLMLEPKLLMLDEPSAGMNPQESQDLKGVFETLRAQGITLLIVEHNMRLVADVADRVIVMDAGALLAEGTPDEVAADPAVRAAYLGS